MDNYIRDFQYPKIFTEEVQTMQQCNEVFKINNFASNFKIMHCNIRSIHKNLDELKILLCQMTEPFECIVLTETHHIEYLGMYDIDGYSILYNNGLLNQNDGVVIYLRNNLIYDYEIVLFHEISLIEVQITYQSQKIYLLAAYRSPSLEPMQFNMDLYYHLLSIKTANYNYSILIGDINIDILNKSEHAHKYLDILSEFGFLSTINNYTRVQQNTRSCIDHIFLNTKHNYELALPLIIKTNITDHYITTLQIITEDHKYNSIKTDSKYLKYTNFKKLSSTLQSTNWAQLYRTRDSESATNIFVQIIKNSIQICTVYKKVRHKNVKRKDWITNGLVKSINYRNELYINLKKNPQDNALKTEYNNYKKNLVKLINKTKTNYYKQQIEQNKHNKQYLWNTVNKLKKNDNKNQINTIKNKQNQILKSHYEIANEFNETYIEMGKKLADNITPDQSFISNNRVLLNSFYLLPTDKDEVYNTIKSLKNKKSTGIDGISVKIIKETANFIIEPLTYVINLIFDTNTVPSIFKTSVIKPIYKKGDKSSCQNYRPISIITNFAKIFEKILKSRLDSYISKYKIISTKQYGFQKGLSTQDAISYLTDNIYRTIDKGLPSLAIFLDLAKAFDTVTFPLLLNTLENIGIRGNSLSLLSSYIIDRKQCVEVNSIKSDFQTVKYGVPQGTVLGPLLFVLYINDLFLMESCGDILTFADDTVIYYVDQTWQELKTKAENDFLNIKKWFDSRILTLNFDKTFFLPFASYKNSLPEFQSLTITDRDNSLIIHRTDTIKYLGIYIDSHLKWDVHINYVVKKLRSLIPIFKYLKDILPRDNLLTIYYSLVESHINYGILGWGGVNKTILNYLELTQKRIIKIMFKKDLSFPTDELYYETKLFDARKLFYYAICVNQYKNKKDLINISHNYHTRQNSEHYKVEFMRKTIGQRNFKYLSPKIYSSLPHEVKTSKTLNIFKIRCKMYISQRSRIDIHKQIDLKNS